MKTVSLVSKASATALAVLLLASSTSLGGSMWAEHNSKSTLSVEVVRPSYGYGEPFTITSSAMYLTLELVATPAVAFTLEIPAAYANLKRDPYSYEDASYAEYMKQQEGLTLGNPYFGIRWNNRSRSVHCELGIAAPVASSSKDYAILVGQSADFDRFYSFVPDVTTVRGAVDYRFRATSGIFLQVAGGGFLLAPDQGDPELFGQYGAFVGADDDVVTVKGGITGIIWTTVSGPNFSERTWHQLGLEADLKMGDFRPGLEVRVPLDEEPACFCCICAQHRYAIGLRMAYAL
jgi:hypothetical protein